MYLFPDTSAARQNRPFHRHSHITAIEAAVVGQEVVDSTYKKKRIVIAFNPIEEVFEVWNPAIGKDSKWIPDISVGVSKIADDF